MILSILVFIFFSITMYFLLKMAVIEDSKRNTKGCSFFIMSAILLFSLISGLRYRYGADCESYALCYLQTEKLGYYLSGDGRYFEESEKLFALLTIIMAKLGVGRVVYLTFWAFIEVVFFIKALHNRKFLLPFWGLAFVMGPVYLSAMNGIRQMIAAFIFAYAISVLIDKRNYVIYILLVLLGVGFHASALALIPFVFIIKYKYFPNRIVILAIYAICVYIGNTEYMKGILIQGETVLSLLGYVSYAEQIESLADAEATIQNYGPRQLILMFSNILIIWFSKSIDRWQKGEQFWRICYLFFSLYACFYALLHSASSLFTRPLYYFMPFALFSLSYLLTYINTCKKIQLLWFVLLVTCSFNILQSIAESGVKEESDLYKFIFMYDGY